ncbi:HET-domain-containing protein, partial [Lindgomyces ingoldianus]
QVLQWSQNCSSLHPHCKPRIIPREEWPTRLLDVGGADSPVIRLCDTIKLDITTLEYTTLSHCWGDYIPIRLLKSNYSSFVDGKPLCSLPKTFQDAVEVTRKLDVRFLWIDSLCIVQDSTSDWAKESGKMRLVYRNSSLTIAAAAAVDATGGLFSSRNPLTVVPCSVELGDGHGSRHAWSMYMSEDEEEETNQQRSLILFTRAWVLQERLLSPLLLIFGKRELYWECLRLYASEVYPEGIRFFDRSYGLDIFTLRRVWNNRSDSSWSPWRLWNAIFSRYSGLKLSHTSDKLVALAGLAADLHTAFPNMIYLAGIWSNRLRRGLLWYCYDGSPWRKPCYTAPSWSWASIDAPVWTNNNVSFSDAIAEVLDAQVSLSSPANPYGMVTDGHIRLKAPLVRLGLRRGSIGRRWYIADSNEESESGTEDSEYGIADSIPNSTIEINIALDDRAASQSIQSFFAYLVPLAASLTKRGDGLHLEGLILIPTHLKRGQFRRIGYFYLRDYW